MPNYFRLQVHKFYHNNIVGTSVTYNILLLDVEKNVDGEFIDSQRPGLRISTFFRQLLFDVLYVLEFVFLLWFGLLAKVEEFKETDKQHPNATFIYVIVSTWVIALVLRILYYSLLHVWSNYIVTGKELIRKELEDENPETDNAADTIRNAFFQYVFIARNTWICGSLKHVQATFIILPKSIIECITGQGQDLDGEVKRVLTKGRKGSKFMCIPVFLLGILCIILLLVMLLLSIPILMIMAIWNCAAKNGFDSLSADGKVAHILKDPLVTILPFLFC
jgi:hypothetical protein